MQAQFKHLQVGDIVLLVSSENHRAHRPLGHVRHLNSNQNTPGVKKVAAKNLKKPC